MSVTYAIMQWMHGNQNREHGNFISITLKVTLRGRRNCKKYRKY